MVNAKLTALWLIIWYFEVGFFLLFVACFSFFGHLDIYFVVEVLS